MRGAARGADARSWLWLIFFGALALILGLKATQLGWFTSHPPLELDGQQALLFFNKARGCEYELFVYDNANAQIEVWNVPMHLICVYMDHRPDLARQYQVVCAPALVLLSAEAQAVWKQVESLSDEAPFDLNQAECQIEALTSYP